MKNAKRLLCIALTLTFVVTAAACGKPSDNNEGTGKTTETTGNDNIYSSLPEKTYNGDDYCIINAELTSIEGALGIDFESDDAAASAIPVSVYKRNLDVEERFKVVIKHFSTTTLYDTLSATVASGDLEYHAIYGDYTAMSNLAAGEYLTDLSDVSYLDLSAEWWNKSAQNNLSIDGRQYLAINDVPYSVLITTHCMYFNKTLAETYAESVGNPYDYVFDGTWTIDKLIQTSRNVSKDDGDQKWDENDTYGISLSIGSLTMLGVAFGESVYPISIKNGEIVDTDEDKWTTIINKIYTLCYDNDNSTYVGAHLSDYALTMFTEGKALYYIGALCDAPMYFRDMEDDFGILPFPKYNEKQEEYYTALSGASLMFGISTLPNESQLEFIGIITEAMAIKSHQLLRTAVYETVFDDQLTRDEESKQTMDIIVNSLNADFVFVHAAGITGYYGEIHMLMETKSNLYTSARRRNKTKLEVYYQGVLDIYHGLN